MLLNSTHCTVLLCSAFSKVFDTVTHRHKHKKWWRYLIWHLQYLCICLSYRIKENGQERTEIEEDGVLKSILINGKLTHCTVIVWLWSLTTHHFVLCTMILSQKFNMASCFQGSESNSKIQQIHLNWLAKLILQILGKRANRNYICFWTAWSLVLKRWYGVWW